METNATPQTAVAPRAPAAVSVAEASGELSGIKLRYLKPTFGVGPQHDAGFPEGTLVLDEKFIVGDKTHAVPAIIVSASKYWKDYISSVEWNAGKRSQRYTLEEARATGKRVYVNKQDSGWVDDPAGGLNANTGRPNRLGPEISPAADLKLLLRRPDKVTDKDANELFAELEFPVRIGQFFYCPSQVTYDRKGFHLMESVLDASLLMAAQEQHVKVKDAKLSNWLYLIGVSLLPATKYSRASIVATLARMQDPVTKRAANLSAEEIAELAEWLPAISTAKAEPAAPESDDANP